MRFAGLLFFCLTLGAVAQMRTVAITVDDLPCTDCEAGAPDGPLHDRMMKETNKRLVSELVRAQVPATGFVITQEVEESGRAGQRVLRLWLRAGLDLGSHSYSHPDFIDLSTEEMEGNVARADSLLRPLLKANGRTLEFFRFPYNHTGETQAKHDAMAAYLKADGYQVAACTIDASDYTFAAAYARAVGLKDASLAKRIRREYLAYSASEIDFYAALNRRVLGYEPPEVLLIHDSLLNADSMDDLLELFRSRGYRFVSLKEAQRDPAYAIADTYVGRYGSMWGYRWAEERKAEDLAARDPGPPDWVMSYADGKPVPEQTKPGQRRKSFISSLNSVEHVFRHGESTRKRSGG
jgi:peptidoglycan/xylan/chitin deacetylase (PgdA/CDA1 family)